MTDTGRLSRAVVRLVASSLPTGGARARYRAELVAELHGLRPAQRLTFVCGLVVHAWALRRAVAAGLPPRATLALGCRTQLHHRWHVATNPDGQRYLRCRRCGKDDPSVGPFEPGAMVITLNG